jgi:hypothetical protein
MLRTTTCCLSIVLQGPIVAEAIFLNREELPVHPVYYDPVHDFGFLRFDPSKLQFMQVRHRCTCMASTELSCSVKSCKAIVIEFACGRQVWQAAVAVHSCMNACQHYHC